MPTLLHTTRLETWLWRNVTWPLTGNNISNTAAWVINSSILSSKDNYFSRFKLVTLPTIKPRVPDYLTSEIPKSFHNHRQHERYRLKGKWITCWPDCTMWYPTVWRVPCLDIYRTITVIWGKSVFHYICGIIQQYSTGTLCNCILPHWYIM